VPSPRPAQKALEGRLERPAGKIAGQRGQRLQRSSIQRICKGFSRRPPVGANLHPDPYSSKFPPFTLQVREEFGAPLAENRGNRAGISGQFELPVPAVGNAYPHREGPRQKLADMVRQRLLRIAAGCPCGERRVGADDASEGLGEAHGGEGGQAGAVRSRTVPAGIEGEEPN